MIHSYFTKHNTFIPQIESEPDSNLGIVVVIPSFNEPNLWASLYSLLKCEQPKCSVEVLVVVNYPFGSTKEVEENALTCIDIIEKANSEKLSSHIHFYSIKAFNLPTKHAGVGLARKIGMDEAAWRFQKSNCAHKIITCFDADSTCLPNYFVELESLWARYPKTSACSIRYEHPLFGDEYDQNLYKGIAQYELHLRYYVLAGKYIGHPFSYQTVGSSMACSADTYLRFGGMNRNKAGEDFYFLQKIIPHGEFRTLNCTAIFPSPRPSYRVPFGTGRAMTKYLANDCPEYLSYNLNSFISLKEFLLQAPNVLYNASNAHIQLFWQSLPESIKAFIGEFEFSNAIAEINANSSNITTFTKRFFLWFDAFKLLKYLNFANETYFKKEPIIESSKGLLNLLKIKYSPKSTINDLLLIYRSLDFEK